MKKNYIKDRIFNTNLIFVLIVILFSNNLTFSQENIILVKIENEIITSLDVKNESKYLTALNNNINSLSKKEIFEISKRSIIKEKIKKIELSKNFNDPKIPEKILEKILENVYSKIGIKTLEQFKSYLQKNKVPYENVKHKIEVEALWNELIYAKFNSKIKIDKDKIKNEIINRNKKNSKSFLMSEIFFEISNLGDLENKFLEIDKTIKEKGFDNAALSYSTSNTSSVGGKLGWIKYDSLNKELKNIILDMKINEHTKPIPISGGFLILKINEIKDIKINQDLNLEIKKMINSKKNNQLNQFSKIYYNKIKKDIQINEL